jgi:hypothetical protein
MRYRKPFDLAQRQLAITQFRSLRHNYNILRRFYSPSGANEKAVLRQYRQLIEQFRDELRKFDKDVAPDRLNGLGTKLAAAFIQYMTLKMQGGGI